MPLSVGTTGSAALHLRHHPVRGISQAVQNVVSSKHAPPLLCHCSANSPIAAGAIPSPRLRDRFGTSSRTAFAAALGRAKLKPLRPDFSFIVDTKALLKAAWLYFASVSASMLCQWLDRITFECPERGQANCQSANHLYTTIALWKHLSPHRSLLQLEGPLSANACAKAQIGSRPQAAHCT